MQRSHEGANYVNMFFVLFCFLFLTPMFLSLCFPLFSSAPSLLCRSSSQGREKLWPWTFKVSITKMIFYMFPCVSFSLSLTHTHTHTRMHSHFYQVLLVDHRSCYLTPTDIFIFSSVDETQQNQKKKHGFYGILGGCYLSDFRQWKTAV